MPAFDPPGIVSSFESSTALPRLRTSSTGPSSEPSPPEPAPDAEEIRPDPAGNLPLHPERVKDPLRVRRDPAIMPEPLRGWWAADTDGERVTPPLPSPREVVAYVIEHYPEADWTDEDEEIEAALTTAAAEIRRRSSRVYQLVRSASAQRIAGAAGLALAFSAGTRIYRALTE